MHIKVTATYVETNNSSRDVSALETEGMSRAQVNKLKSEMATTKLKDLMN